MSLDPDDPRPPYQQVAAALRAAILTRQIAPGDKLPSQVELARRYGVARMTVQQALRILKDEGLTVSRQGSGVFAKARTERPIGLRPHIERAFEQPNVEIDFSGYTAETLHGIIAEPLDKIRSGRLSPSSIRIRMLLSDMSRPLSLPVNVDNNPGASGPARARMAEISTRHAGAITATVEELADLGLVRKATVETRLHGSAPLFKVYIVNGIDAFFGYYPVVRHEVRIGSKRQAIFDPMGKDAVMFQRTDDGDAESADALFVTQTRLWFDSVWDTIAAPPTS
ncbi:GntR family transcriptional regulator [Terrabacter terrae]|uniref:GntR family transcriptional regulator n=1 Tax=Terrabacter terrae TaxID=318434 RepID=A0ABN2TSD0_9MICO